jgi:glycosyltransferase involved in cell wall biosynthesis
LITVGIPVFNEEKYISKALSSVVHQADQIIICDNASTDNTSHICKEYAEKYNNITYIRHEKNIGSWENFFYPLNLTKTDYFMWLGGHDVLSENYIETLTKTLEVNSDAVLAYGPAERIDQNGNTKHTNYYDYRVLLSSMDTFQRVFAIISYLSDCSLIHGVFRTEPLKNSWFNIPCIGVDHILLCKAISQGHFLYEPSTRFFRRDTREETLDQAHIRQIRALNSSIQDREYVFHPHRIMQQEQLNVVKNITADPDRRKNWIEKSRIKLIERYGEFDTIKFYKEVWLDQLVINEKGISNILHTQNVKNVAIFGTRKIGLYLYKDLVKENFNVVTFIDNNGYKQKEKIYDTDIFPSKWLIENKDKIDLVVTSIEGAHDTKIKNDIEKMIQGHAFVLSWKDLIEMNLSK